MLSEATINIIFQMLFPATKVYPSSNILDMFISGSPFHQEISEGTLPPAHGEGLHRGEEDKPATFVIDARNLKGEPSVQVDGQSQVTV